MNGEAIARTAAIAGGRGSMVIYAIHPRSFQATGDAAEGTLAGIEHRLGHVAALGVDAIWLGPIFPSPMADGGYDVADYRAVDPRFGTLEDCERLIKAAHDHGLAVLMDLVINHTSDMHPWFQAALAGDDARAAYYKFQPARSDGAPPNNWRSFFGGPAWRWVPQRRAYVLTQFSERQPALDLCNEGLQRELAETVGFWIARGVDGFRLDAVASYLSDDALTDNPPADEAEREESAVPTNNAYAFQSHRHDILPAESAAFTAVMRDWVGERQFLLGELNVGPNSMELARAFTAPGRLDAVYTVDLTSKPVTPLRLAELVERKGDAGIAWLMSSHDQARAASRLGDGSARDACFWLSILLTLPGHAILYQGEELGLPQPDLPLEALRDLYDRAYFPEHPGRDGARVPMPWEGERPNAGFSLAEPWLPPHPEAAMLAVDRQHADPASTLHHARALLALRRAEPALHAAAAIVEHVDDTSLILRRPHHAGDLRQIMNFDASAPLACQPAGARLLSDPADDPASVGPRRVRIEKVAS